MAWTKGTITVDRVRVKVQWERRGNAWYAEQDGIATFGQMEISGKTAEGDSKEAALSQLGFRIGAAILNAKSASLGQANFVRGHVFRRYFPPENDGRSRK